MTNEHMAELKDTLDVIQKAFTIAGLFIGGIWAYYKFFKGRVFTTRLEPKVSGKVILNERITIVIVTVSLKNVGLSKVDIKQAGTGLRVSSHRPREGINDPLEAEWRDLGVFSIFTSHCWIEPGETIMEDKVVEIPGVEHSTFLLECRIVSNKLSFVTNKAITLDDDEDEPEKTLE